jgi:Phosphorylase superfamily
MLTSEDIILVPQGAEYRSIRRGLAKLGDLAPQIIPITIGAQEFVDGSQKLQQSLEILNKLEKKIVILGLAGSLSERYRIGDGVIYQGCGLENGDYWQFDPQITTEIAQLTGYRQVKALTSPCLVSQAIEKRRLGQLGYEVVDMEGARILSLLAGLKVAMVRVISDQVEQDLPDLAAAIDNQGNLQPFLLTRQMLTSPMASLNLIRGSLKGLSVLAQIAQKLCGGNL